MSSFKSLESWVVPQAIDATETTQKLPLGTIIRAEDKASTAYGIGEFIYLKGVSSTAVGTVVIYNPDDFSTTRASANAIGPVAVAMSANVANQYGWYQISGKAVVKAATVVDNATVYISGTAGTLDDAVVDGDMVHLAKFASADGTPSAGFAEIEISRPYTDDITTND